MALDGCSQLCKCILILINITFGLLGVVMLGLGLWLRYSSETGGLFNVDLNTQQFVIGVILLIVLGVLMLIISIFGTSGACLESRCCLALFCFLLLLLAGAEIAAGVLTFQYKEEVGLQLSVFYHNVYVHYVNTVGDPSMAITLKFFHSAFDCCGILGKVLEPIVMETCPQSGFLQAFTIPPCSTTIPNIISSKASAFLGGFVGLAAILIFAVICSCTLYKNISRSISSPPPYILLSSHAGFPQDPTFAPGSVSDPSLIMAAPVTDAY
ncbi:CD9 antigen-like isoform X1 [Arapaima gigas]